MRLPKFHRARVVAKRKSNLYMCIRLVLLVYSRVRRVSHAIRFRIPHTLWILMARFVFTTRRWIFHRCVHGVRGEGVRGRDRHLEHLQLENDQWQCSAYCVLIVSAIKLQLLDFDAKGNHVCVCTNIYINVLFRNINQVSQSEFHLPTRGINVIF